MYNANHKESELLIWELLSAEVNCEFSYLAIFILRLNLHLFEENFTTDAWMKNMLLLLKKLPQCLLIISI